MPCYNERDTIEEVVGLVLASPWVAELLIVDDGSTDGTRDILHTFTDPRVRVFEQPINLGKGAALRRGFVEATQDYVIVQDADLEYDPSEYTEVLGPLLDGRADVVYGSRFMGGRPHRVLYYWHSVGNQVLTTASNMFTNLNLTDMETCYKAFRREVIQGVQLEEDRFGFEPEITAKVAKAGWRIYEVGISYSGRTYEEGKKIGWRDGVRAIYSIVRYSRVADRVAKRAVDRESGVVHHTEADAEQSETLDNLADADNYADWIVSLCEPHLGDAVLEIGAGHGELTERFARSRSVTATEVSTRRAEELGRKFASDRNVVVHYGDFASTGAVGRYDSAVLVNVLEHVEDHLGMVKSAYEALRPGGRLIIFAPAFEGLYSEFDRRIGHFRRYRVADLVGLVDRAGYRVVEARYVNAVGALMWWVFARHLRQTPTQGWSTRLFDRLVVPLVRKREAARTPRFGQSVFVVAEKPGAGPVEET
jgi:SAM-dependent methyltransferase